MSASYESLLGDIPETVLRIEKQAPAWAGFKKQWN